MKSRKTQEIKKEEVRKMGWFKIKDGKIGDKPADIMGKALAEIRVCYQEEFKRIEKPKEMLAVFNFCYKPMNKMPFKKISSNFGKKI